MIQNNFIRYAVTLGVICICASGLLGTVYSFTKDKIAAQEQKEVQDSLKDVLSGADRFESVETNRVHYYIGYSSENDIAGYAFLAQKHGYSSTITTMVGIDPKGTITGIKILSQNETPGLGTKVVEVKDDTTIWSVIAGDEKAQKTAQPATPWFQDQFKGKDATTLAGVQTITGATISSSAVINSIQKAAVQVLEEIQRGR